MSSQGDMHVNGDYEMELEAAGALSRVRGLLAMMRCSFWAQAQTV